MSVNDDTPDSAEHSRHQDGARLAAMVESSAYAMLAHDLEGCITEWNPAAEHMFGYPFDDIRGSSVTVITAEHDRPKHWAVLQRILDGEAVVEFPAKGQRHNGELIDVTITAVPLFDDAGKCVGGSAVIRDVGDQIRASEQLIAAATHDPLTGLANRTLLVDDLDLAIKASIRSGLTTAVMLMDLDHFKFVNDSLGHTAGDDLLRIAAKRIEHAVRAGDRVCRLGGDEFVVVMRDVEDVSEAIRVANRICTEFRGPLEVGSHAMICTASVGLAFSRGTHTADELINEADTAMYLAKSEGRDRVSLFGAELRQLISDRVRIENELRPASHNGELAVWYQPEIDLLTGEVHAVESLLRWHHPSGQLFTAGQFIDVAEETGLILGIGNWVVHTACAQAALWNAARSGHLVTVRVNLSALQLTETGLLEDIDEALASSQATPSQLCVEITESVMLRNSSTVHRNLAGIRDRGIGIAIDDFGTGFASLSFLLAHPVDVLKLDRSFVANIATDEHDRRVVAGIVALAKHLQIDVTAEGVETEEQAVVLRELGCTGAQGYWYSAAVPSDGIDRLLNA